MREELASAGIVTDLLDLSLLSSGSDRNIHPCKGCASTAMPLCHWPCNCCPNHPLGQTNDWMAEIYPLWVAAHAIVIVTPVYWYQSPSPLTLMIDRLVCADGGDGATDPVQRPTNPGATTMPSDRMPNSTQPAPMNGSTMPAAGNNATNATTGTGSLNTDTLPRAPMSGADGSTMPAERLAKLDRD